MKKLGTTAFHRADGGGEEGLASRRLVPVQKEMASARRPDLIDRIIAATGRTN